MFKKLVSLSLSLSLIGSTFLAPTYANSIDTSSSKTVVSDKSLKNGKLLSKDDVLSIAKYHIGSYMKTDSQTKGKNIVPREDFINLYDLDDNLFAYIVPLVEKGKKEIGYITVGALEDGYDVYEIFIEENAMKDFREKLKPAGSKLVFTPPFSYVVKNQSKYIGTTKNVNENQDVSESVSNNSEVKKIYESIRSAENKNHLQNILNQASKVTIMLDYSDSSCEDVRLVNEAKGYFNPVYDQYGNVFYGGDQGWWKDSNTLKVGRGCGPTAAANITCYLARNNYSRYGKLYAPTLMTLGEYLRHMNLLYNALDPSMIGVFTLSAFKNGVVNYASERGVYLSSSVNDCSGDIDTVSNFIKYGLNDDSPVACLNRQPTGYDYGWHWMTITKYYRDISTDARWIAVSTWGQRKSIPLKEYYDSTHFWGGGFVYFY